MAKEVYKRYSEAFRIQVVREYEAGASMNELQKKYGIRGTTTISKWIKRYSTEGVRHQLMVIQSPEEQNRIKELEEQIRRQEELIAQLALDKLMLESTLEVIQRQYGIEVKKIESISSKQPTKEENG